MNDEEAEEEARNPLRDRGSRGSGARKFRREGHVAAPGNGIFHLDQQKFPSMLNDPGVIEFRGVNSSSLFWRVIRLP